MLVAVRADVSRCCLIVVTFLLASLHFTGIYPALVYGGGGTGDTRHLSRHLNCILLIIVTVFLQCTGPNALCCKSLSKDCGIPGESCDPARPASFQGNVGSAKPNPWLESGE